MNQEQAEKKEQELYYLAVGRCLDKIDWDISDWLDDKEWVEYEKARKIVYEEAL